MKKLENLLSKLNSKLIVSLSEEIFYINGSETLPPPLSQEREQ